MQSLIFTDRLLSTILNDIARFHNVSKELNRSENILYNLNGLLEMFTETSQAIRFTNISRALSFSEVNMHELRNHEEAKLLEKEIDNLRGGNVDF